MMSSENKRENISVRHEQRENSHPHLSTESVYLFDQAGLIKLSGVCHRFARMVQLGAVWFINIYLNTALSLSRSPGERRASREFINVYTHTHSQSQAESSDLHPHGHDTCTDF